jgi:hypothetical protein
VEGDTLVALKYDELLPDSNKVKGCQKSILKREKLKKKQKIYCLQLFYLCCNYTDSLFLNSQH